MIRAARRSIALSIAATVLAACSTSAAPTIAVVPIGSPSPDLPNVVIQATIGSAVAPTASPAPPTAAPETTPTLDPGICPLTGLPVEGVDWMQRRPIVIQIGNSPPERPQSELALADVVFEHIAEGGVTRFSAVYLCRDALNVGPVRSGRLINLDNVPMLNAILAFSGASDGVLGRLLSSELRTAMLYADAGDPGFRRLETRQPPFNLYASTEAIWSAARERGFANPARFSVLKFGDAPADGAAAARVDLPIYPGTSDVSYTYDDATGVYLRSMGGFPHTDLSTGQPLGAANVLIIYAAHAETDIVEDSLGNRSVQIDLTSGGRAQLLRDGLVYAGAWSRPDARAFFELTDASGRPLLLKPGVTWVEIVRTDLAVVIQ